jgi:hypothetical protein
MEQERLKADKAVEKLALEGELRRIRDGIWVRFFQRLRQETWAAKASGASLAAPVCGKSGRAR